MEETGLWKPLLSSLHPGDIFEDNSGKSYFVADPGHKLCNELHLPSAEEQVGGGQDRGVRPLRMSRMFRITSLVSKIIHYCWCWWSSVGLSRLFWMIPDKPSGSLNWRPIQSKSNLSLRNVRLSLANLELNIECAKERELSDFRLQRCKRGYNGADRRIQDPQQGKNASLWKIKQLFLNCFLKLIFLRRQGSPAVAPRATYLATQTPQKTMWTHPKVALATSSTRRSQHPSTTRTPQCRKGNNWRLFVTWRRREGVSGDRENLELENLDLFGFLWYVSKSKHRCLCNVPTLSIFCNTRWQKEILLPF